MPSVRNLPRFPPAVPRDGGRRGEDAGILARSSILTALLCLSLVAAWGVTRSQPAWAMPSEAAPASEVAWAPSDDDARLVALINRSREAAGLGDLVADPDLCRAARAYAEAMIDGGFFAHVSKSSGTPADRVRRAGVAFRAVYENLAGAGSVDAAQRAFMRSPGHRANILRGEATRLGVAFVRGGPYGGMIVEIFVVPPDDADGDGDEAPEPAVATADGAD